MNPTPLKRQKMKIKADETLFKEWDKLKNDIVLCGNRIGMCNAIIQNDMIIDKTQLDEWKIHVMDLQNYLLELKFATEILMNKTLDYVKNCNKPTPRNK
jgi:hypothetical protein